MDFLTSQSTFVLLDIVDLVGYLLYFHHKGIITQDTGDVKGIVPFSSIGPPIVSWGPQGVRVRTQLHV